MLRVRLKLLLLLLLTAYPPLLCAKESHSEESPSISGRDKAKVASCGKNCEDRTNVRKRSTPEAKCELYYFAPTAPSEDELFAFWNNSKAEQLEAYRKIASFLKANPHEDEPLFFPAHIPLVVKHNGHDVLVLKDVYVRAKGICGDLLEENDLDTNPARKSKLSLHEEVTMLEEYVERMPRSHWGYRVPKPAEDDACLDDTGLVVKDFPGIGTCFSMWIFDDRDPKPKHFAGRQIYNRINQTLSVYIPKISFDPSSSNSHVEPIRTKWFSLASLFLNEMCYVTNASYENRCTYWTTDSFYVSLCCCYTNRRECAYKNFKFPSQKKSNDTKIRACATGDYYVLKGFGGNHGPKNASDIASSVKEFVQERTSSEVCKWTSSWEDVLRVNLDTEKQTALPTWMGRCTSKAPKTCCQRTATLCPLDPNSNNNTIGAECFCNDGDLCNKQHSSLDKDLVIMFLETRPCEAHTVYEHVLWQSTPYKKPYTNPTEGFTCPVFYHFTHPGRENLFLQLLFLNNFEFAYPSDMEIFQGKGCHLVEVAIREKGDCTDKLFGEHNETLSGLRLILLCSVEGNPIGEPRKSYPDAELKNTIEANLTVAKAEFPKCKTGSWSLDFESLSQLVVDNRKLERKFDNLTDGTNGIFLSLFSCYTFTVSDNTTTAYCYVEVNFVYQQQYNFTFGEVSIDDMPLQYACDESVNGGIWVRRNSTANDQHQHFTMCCPRHWSQSEERCRRTFIVKLKQLVNKNAIAETSEKIMGELKEGPLTKCIDEDNAHEGQAGTKINRPCARNDGCYTSVHARDIPTSSQPKEYGGCVSEYAPNAKKRDDSTIDDVEARFARICRLARNRDQCFAVLGTEDPYLPDDVKSPQMVCCCGGQLQSTQKCGTGQEFGMKVGDFH